MTADAKNRPASGPLPPVTRDRRIESRRKAVAHAVLAGLVLFLGGVVAGGGAAIVYFKRQTLAESPSPERIGNLLMTSLTREFALTPEETAGIRACVGRQVAAMEASSQAYSGSVRSQFGALCGELCAILGPSRAKKWKTVMREKFGENASVYIQMPECGVEHDGDCDCELHEGSRRPAT